MDDNSYGKYWIFSSNLLFVEEAGREWNQRKNKRNYRLLKKNIIDAYNCLDYHENQARETYHTAEFKAYKQTLLELRSKLQEQEKQINEDEPDYNVIDFGDNLDEDQKKTIERFKDNYFNLRTPPAQARKALLEIKDELCSDNQGRGWFEKTLERLQREFQRNQHTDEWVRFSGYDTEAKNMKEYYERHPEEKKGEIDAIKIPKF
jgi:hypothetical protein